MNDIPRIQVFKCPQCYALYPTDQWNVQRGRCNQCAGNKYGNKKIKVGSRTFDSIDEHNRWRELEWQEQEHEIDDLVFHPRFDIVVAGIYIGKMTLDSGYRIHKTGQSIYEDVKSEPTRREPAYRLRKKLIEALYNITITEFMY
jgi:hypothetical protein